MSLIKQHLYELQSQSDDTMTDFPIYKKQLPQIWMEDDKFIIESSSFRYVIEDDLKLLFKLCRRFKADAIKQTYITK